MSGRQTELRSEIARRMRVISKAEAKALMRRCRAGCGGDDPLDEALDLLAECCSMIGKLVQERTRCAKLLEISRSEACLLAGEMTAQEWRTVAAVLAALKARMLRDD